MGNKRNWESRIPTVKIQLKKKTKKRQGREEPQLIKKKIYTQREREGKLRETSVVSAGGGAVFPLPFILSLSQLC